MRAWLQKLKRRFFAIEEVALYLKSQQDALFVAQETYVLQLLQQPRYQDPKRLALYEGQVFSRQGNDGILDEVFKRIGTTSRTFVEIGCGDGLENNTTNLLRDHWHGFWFDGSSRNVESVRRNFEEEITAGSLVVAQSFLTRSNALAVLRSAGVPTELDLLSIDIDRNTYHVWSALAELRPRVVVIEYNAKALPSCDWKVSDIPDRAWDGSSYFGASLKAYESLGREMGYSLVGCDITGVDAYFVRNDQPLESFASPFTAENHYEPARYFLVRSSGHPNSFRD